LDFLNILTKFFLSISGYLAAMALGRPLDKCVAAGIFAARTIIQNSGCTFPAICQYNEPK